MISTVQWSGATSICDGIIDVDVVQNNLGMLSKFPHSKVVGPINVWDKDFQPLIAVEDKLWIYLL